MHGWLLNRVASVACLLLLVVLPNGGFAQNGFLSHEYKDWALKMLSTEVLKDKKLQGDCQCSRHLHKNYPLVVEDTIYKPSLMDKNFGLFWMNLQHPPFTPRSVSEILSGLSLEDLSFTSTPDKVDVVPSSKTINPTTLPKHYYKVTRLTPFHHTSKVFAFYILEEVQEKKVCTPIYITVVLESGALLEATTATLCD